MISRAPAPEPAEARLLTIAAEHVRRFGAARVTVVGVAAEAGMTHANVYRYFPSKLALLEEITAAWLRPLETSLHEAAEGADPAYDKLERMLLAVHRAYRAKLDSDPALFDLLADSLVKERATARKHRARVQAEMQRVVEEGVASGAFAMADRRRALALVFDASHRFIHPVALRLDKDTPAPALAQRFERIVSMTTRALRTGRT
jgi:AcrR family transcriptional regulator